jgi:hypothetical protein
LAATVTKLVWNVDRNSITIYGRSGQSFIVLDAETGQFLITHVITKAE